MDEAQPGIIAIGGGQVIWTMFHKRAGVVTSEIRVPHFDGSDPRILADPIQPAGPGRPQP
jgi:hypothetical protein